MPEVEVLLPVYNEAESIEGTIREIYRELSSKLTVGFIICEDGSRDNTKEILRRLSEELPLRLNLSDARKGYSQAVREGMEMLEADYLLCLDSDGQCDPKDFWQFWERRSKADLVIGWRVKRADNLARRYMSRFFYLIWQGLFRVPVHDPSCPYILVKRSVVQRLVKHLGAMQQGLWWEFVARVHRAGFSTHELPIKHRPRSAGTTQVYKPAKMAGIFWHHFCALFVIHRETRANKTRKAASPDHA